MRTFLAAMGLAAFAALPATAQTGVSRGSAPVTPSTTGNTATTTNLPSTAVGDKPVLSAPGTGTDTTSSVAGGVPVVQTVRTPATDLTNSTPPFGPGGSFSNDSGNSALGQSAGQSSSGTLAGNSSQGIGDGFSTLPGTAVLVPEGNVSVIGAGATGSGASGSGAPGTSVVVNPQVQQGSALGASNTPLFDQAAREGRAREQRRRAQGVEPRIYGIAPNTERDLTWQMPDDPIIRY